MLINVTHDRVFQRYLDREEQRLHIQMVPVLKRGIWMQLRDGGVPAQNYVMKRGEQILVRHYKRIFREVYGTVEHQITRQQNPNARGVSTFLDRMLDIINLEGAQRIQYIAQSLMDAIREGIMQGIEEGRSNTQIARELYEMSDDISQVRAATIARTETHGAAMWAMDETIDEKGIPIEEKQWYTAGDARVRDSHAAMHGVTIPRDEPFSLDGGDLMYPGDDSLGADAGEIVNCRCSCLYLTPEGL